MTFPVVTICGSMRFYNRMLKAAERLTAQGNIVLMPFVTTADTDRGHELKTMLDEMHRRKIDLAEMIVVVTDPDTMYIGESTNAEIQYANDNGKHIHWALESPC